MQSHYKTLIVRIWFLLNLFFSLYPPLYWQVGAIQKQLFGLPLAFVYFIAIAISITLSILYAYWEEAAREGWN